jgi:hypothetical protein
MLMVNFETLAIEDVEQFDTIDIVLGWNPSFLDESFRTFKNALETKVEEELDKHLFKKPAHFRFITRFTEEDLDLIVDNLINEVVSYLSLNTREREARLGRPKELDNILMLNATIMDCINNNLSTNTFNISILDKNDQEFFSIMDEVNNKEV